MSKRKHVDVDTDNALTDIYQTLATDNNATAKSLCESIRLVKLGTEGEVRGLCEQFDVAKSERNAAGKFGKRSIVAIRAALREKLKESGHRYISNHRTSASSTTTGSGTDVAEQAKSSTQFDLEHALDDTRNRIKSIRSEKRMMVRVIDHACSSPLCVSHRIVNVMKSLFSDDVSADLSDDQPFDACGYIAADATCALRDAALSKSNSWFDVQLKNYSLLDCVNRGNRALGKHDGERILSSDDVNRLVRHYAGIDQRHQAAEEWFAGAVALDYFLRGLPAAIKELHNTRSFHQWRVWIINTQTSTQRGSHWFTLAIGVYLTTPIDAQIMEISTDEAFSSTDIAFSRSASSSSAGAHRQANASSRKPFFMPRTHLGLRGEVRRGGGWEGFQNRDFRFSVTRPSELYRDSVRGVGSSWIQKLL